MGVNIEMEKGLYFFRNWRSWAGKNKDQIPHDIGNKTHFEGLKTYYNRLERKHVCRLLSKCTVAKIQLAEPGIVPTGEQRSKTQMEMRLVRETTTS